MNRRQREEEITVSIVDKAIDTQLRNIQAKIGKTLEQLGDFLRKSGLTKHGDLRSLLMRELGLGHGGANTVVHVCLKSDGARTIATCPSPPARC